MTQTTVIPAPAATPPQLRYMLSLIEQRDWTGNVDGDEFERIFDVATGSGKFISKREASRCIDALNRCPRNKVEGAPAEVTEEGMYRTSDGTIYRAQLSGAGRLYAKVLRQVPSGSWSLTYEAGAIRNITAADRMTLDEAIAASVEFKMCIRCGAELTAQKSTGRGIGPVCASKI